MHSPNTLSLSRGVFLFFTTMAILATPVLAGDLFVEKSKLLGVDFQHFNGMTGTFFYPEINGPGGALFDYDNDGDLDLYLVQGAAQDGKTPSAPPTDKLYRNDLKIMGDGSRILHFTDVTAQSGITATGYGFGASTGDYNNDGWTDLYITQYGANQLWKNMGDGSFSDVTETAGVGDARWSTSATFLDYDKDGRTDLFVTNYLQYDASNHKTCVTSSGIQDYCGPKSYPDAQDRLYRNLGNGRFEDVTVKAGVHKAFGAGMGVVAADFNGDGWPDLYVANDADPNQLWINQKNGTFVDDALLAGCAVNSFGQNEAGMGVAAADFNSDGSEDLIVTHLTGETHTLYRNDGTGLFEDHTLQTGLGTTSLEATGWGVAFFDYDNDSRLDLLVANGAVEAIDQLVHAKDPYPFHQLNQLFRNVDGSRFEDVTSSAGPAFQLSEVSRGAAFGDLDNDGDTDVVIINNNGPARILINQVGSSKNWLGLNAVDGPQNRSAIGTRICLNLKGGRKLWRRVAVDGSYLSSSDPRVLFGLDGEKKIEGVRVIWPDGREELWPHLSVNQYHTLRKGGGKTP